MPSSYFTPPPYYGGQPGGVSIADLLMRQGEIAAQGAQRSGDIWGSTVAGLGQMAGQGIQQYGETQAEKKRTLAFDAALQSGDPKQIIGVLGPKDGPAFITALQAHTPDGMKKYTDRMMLLRDTARGIKAAPPERQQQLYELATKNLVSNGIISSEEVQPFNPGILDSLANYGVEAKPKAPLKGSPGDVFLNPDTLKPEATIPAVEKPETRSLEIQAAAAKAAGDEATYNRILAVKKQIAQADDRPKEPAKPNWQQGEDAEGNPILYDAATGAVKPFPAGVTPKAGAAEAGRIAGAKAALEASSEIKDYLSRPEVRKTVGPLIGRYNSLAKAAGAGDPTAVQLVGMLKSYAAMQPNIHGFRAVHFASDIEKLLTTKQTPETLEAAIRGIDTAAINVRDRGRHPAGATNTGGPPKLNSKAEWDALPSGAQFISPDGVLRTKP